MTFLVSYLQAGGGNPPWIHINPSDKGGSITLLLIHQARAEISTTSERWPSLISVSQRARTRDSGMLLLSHMFLLCFVMHAEHQVGSCGPVRPMC